MSSLLQAAFEAGAHYDAIPYISHPFAQMQPGRLAGLAKLFGLPTPDVTQAKVLEIGCASGGHLIPLAARNPGATFLGLDPSKVQITEGRGRALAMRLHNLELRDTGIEGLAPTDGPFDYILCHGVYSWVPEDVRHAIMAAIQTHLAPTGVAYISYNVLPGWRLLQGVREALLEATAGLVLPQDKLARARSLLDLMARGSGSDTLWGKLWQQEAERLSAASDDYLVHEFLETHNAPCSFKTFMEQADLCNLSYLCEAELFTMLPENTDPQFAPDLRAFADNRLLGVEQMLDLVNGRMFRQTLLVHNTHAASISRKLMPRSLDGLHLVTSDDLKEVPSDGTSDRCWRDGMGRSISTPHPAAADAIGRVLARLPASTTLAEVTAGLEPAAHDLVADTLFRMLTVGLIDVSTEPVLAATCMRDQPRICHVVRRDAQRGAAVTANLRHETTALTQLDRLILPLADGSRSIIGIAAAIEKTHLVKSLGTNAKDLVEDTLVSCLQRGLMMA